MKQWRRNTKSLEYGNKFTVRKIFSGDCIAEIVCAKKKRDRYLCDRLSLWTKTGSLIFRVPLVLLTISVCVVF